jgi:prepilin-type processing-associated H-X9-DG protein
LLIPAIQKVRAAAALTECAAKLKQLGLALNGYHDVNRHFPIQAYPNLFNTEGYSWMYKILPHIEQEALFKQGSNQAWATKDGVLMQKNAQGLLVPAIPDTQRWWDTWGTVVPAFLCPSSPRPYADMVYRNAHDGTAVAMTTYLGVSGRNSWEDTDGIFGSSNLSVEDPEILENPPKTSVRITQITRGTSNTLVVGERPSDWGIWATPWWSSSLWAVGNITVTAGWDPSYVCPDRAYFSEGDLQSTCHNAHFWSFHSGGGNWLFADGSVQFLTYDAGQTTIPKMSSIYED